jgi:hypothetical protein
VRGPDRIDRTTLRTAIAIATTTRAVTIATTNSTAKLRSKIPERKAAP